MFDEHDIVTVPVSPKSYSFMKVLKTYALQAVTAKEPLEKVLSLSCLHHRLFPSSLSTFRSDHSHRLSKQLFLEFLFSIAHPDSESNTSSAHLFPHSDMDNWLTLSLPSDQFCYGSLLDLEIL